MTPRALLVVFLSAIIPLSRATAQTASATDRSYLQAVAESNAGTIALAQQALATSTRTDVRNLATRLVNERTQGDTALESVAATEGLTLPTTPGLSDTTTSLLLGGLSGRSFDVEYLRYMLGRLQADLELFRLEANQGDAASVTQGARASLPTLQGDITRTRAALNRLTGTSTVR